MNSRLVCVTGVSGFIGAHVARELLARGYQVRGTVRDLARAGQLDRLLGLPGAADRLTLVQADLLNAETFDAAVAGCSGVFHTASPYVLTVRDPQRDLVEPAVQGTRNVLEACRRAGVARVVLTSSMAAITDEPPDRVLTEADWNTSSTLDRNPYYLSKTLAEREAWKFVESRPGFDLVVINPFFVIGPSLTPGLNTSNQVFADILRGAYPAIMNFTWGFVDVRDVALAHALAMETPAAAGRYICAGQTLTMRQVVGIMKAAGYHRNLPRAPLDNPVGNAVGRVAAVFQPKGVASYIRTHIGRGVRYDTSKIRRDLKMEFRPADASIRETLDDLVAWGHIQPPDPAVTLPSSRA